MLFRRLQSDPHGRPRKSAWRASSSTHGGLQVRRPRVAPRAADTDVRARELIRQSSWL